MSDNKSEPEPEIKATKVPIINYETRIHQLAAYVGDQEPFDPGRPVPLRAREHTIVRLAPGLNFVDETLARACLTDDVLDGRMRLSVEDPLDMDPYRAITVAKLSKSRQALSDWRKNETRKQVVKAIDAQLADERTAAEAG